MSAVGRRFFSRRSARLAAGVFGILGAGTGLARPAQAAPPRYADTLPLSQVKPGMKGYGLTTFHGTTISRFEVTVIGILKKANDGHDLILIRMKGGPITERGANLIQGMSGSPIYLNGKIAGAFSMGESFPKEPVGMVTPIDDMLEAWDPNIPQSPAYFQPAEKTPPSTNAPRPSGPNEDRKTGNRKKGDGLGNNAAQQGAASSAPAHPGLRESVVTLPTPIRVGDREISRFVLNVRGTDPRQSSNGTAVLRRATSLLTVGNMPENVRKWMQAELDRKGYNVTVMQGPSIGSNKGSGFAGATLKPGSAFGTFLATGDVPVGGTGTITYVKGNRVLGFGHPLMGMGALEGAITSAYIVDIFSGLQVSHHIAIPGPIIGALRQDRSFSVAGEVGAKPKLVPFDVTVRDLTSKRTQSFHEDMFQHPDFTAVLMRGIASTVIGRVHNVPGDVMARVTTTVNAGEVGTITRSNLVFDASDISSVATQDMTDITGIVSGNPFYPLPIKSASMTVEIMPGHNTATVERIYLKQGRYEPGDTLDVGVVLKPYRRDAIQKTVSLKLPSDLPAGRYQLMVRGGAPSVTRIGPFILSGGGQEAQTPPVNVRQMVARLNNREQNTDMVARLVLNSVAPAVEGEKLSQLPPNLSALMRSDRNSGVRLERDELRTSQRTDYVVSGTQQLIVNVVRKNSQEPAQSGSAFGTSSGSMSPSGSSLGSFPGGGSSSGMGAGDDDAQISTSSRDLTPAQSGGETLPATRKVGETAFVAQENATVTRWLQTYAEPQADWQDPKTDTPESGDDDKKDGEKKPDTPAAPEKPAPVTTPAPVQPEPKTGKSARKQARNKKDAGKNGKSGKNTPAATSTAATPPNPAATTPTAATTDTSNDKPVARPVQTWRQTAKTDFASGKFSGAGVAANGELRLTSTLRRLASTSEIYIWSLVSDAQGNLYAGTGTGGKILKMDATGKTSVFATLPIVSVQSLIMLSDGSLMAGSGVRGQIYHVATDGSYRLAATIKEKYILALAQDSKGNLFVGPGGGGTVYKLDAASIARIAGMPHTSSTALINDAQPAAAATLTPFVKTSADHVMALTVDAQNNLYIGTGNDGIVYKATPDGKTSVVYDAKENAITALTVGKDGAIYAATGPKGILYRINPDGTAGVVYDRATRFFTGLKTAPDGSLYASTVDSVYHLIPSPTNDASQTVVLPLDNPKDVDFLSLAILPNGTVATGTGNIGEIYTSSGDPAQHAAPQGVYTSVVHDAKLTSRWGTLRWSATTPAGSSLNAESRSGNVAEPDATWSAWTPVQTSGVAGEGQVASPSARFFQYRLVLQDDPGKPGEPSVRDVSLSYMPRNQSPHVAFASPAGGERWAKSQTVRWNGTDPDNDTLSYTLLISGDGGATWKPLPGATKTDTKTTPGAVTTTTTTTSAATPAGSATSTVTTVQTSPPASVTTSPDGSVTSGTVTIPNAPTQSPEEFEKGLPANMPPVVKEAIMSAYRRRMTAAGTGAGTTGTDATAGTTRETSKSLDTTTLADGVYQLKVVVTDALSNSVDAQTATAISDPFVVSNAAPRITITGTPRIGANKAVTLEGRATQSLIAITAVQYRIDGGDWTAAVPRSGLFDSNVSDFIVATNPLASGKHTIEIEVFNAANVKATQKADVTIP